MSSQHPGKVLQQQYLAPQKISQNKLARAINVPPRRINEIVHEKRAITADTAVRLSIYFGNSASYWMHLQANFDIDKIKNNIRIQLKSRQAAVIHATTNVASPPVEKKVNPQNVKKRIMR